MIKRTLIAIAVVALLATSAHAGLKETYFGPVDDDYAVKVDGKETPTIRWPYEIKYTALTVCTIPIYMEVGMYVQISDCKDKKVILEQVDCGDASMSKGAGDYPCYYGCVNFDARANFIAQFEAGLVKGKIGDETIINEWDYLFVGDNWIPGDGEWHNVKICVRTWKTQIWDAPPGDEVKIGDLLVKVKPKA